MRRRLWRALIHLDVVKIREWVDFKSSVLSTTWNYKIPVDVGYSDLYPEMTEPAAVQGKCTEAFLPCGKGHRRQISRIPRSCSSTPLPDDLDDSRPSSKYRLMHHLVGQPLPKASPPSDEQLDVVPVNVIHMIKTDTEITNSPALRGFHWFMDFYFALAAYMQIV
ncbi:hypothetical protein F5Y10DRAFT_264351 [Nemania abortiva]|nr:hypothetical protein F5Y10DRAFT_264351 [Nemania abortiva]